MSDSGADDILRGLWMKRRKRTQLRFVQLLQLLEFTFPRRHELKILYRLSSTESISGTYLSHVSKSLVFVVLPWIYRALIKRRLSLGRQHAPLIGGGR